MSKSHVVVEGKSKVLQNAPWHSAILLTGIKRLLVLKFFRGGGGSSLSGRSRQVLLYVFFIFFFCCCFHVLLGFVLDPCFVAFSSLFPIYFCQSSC